MNMKKNVLVMTILATILSGCHIRARSGFKEKIDFHDDLNYGASQNPHQSFDLYLPRAATKPTAAAVFVHGGYWRNQSRNYYRAFTGLYENFGLALASRGVATAVIDYRLFPQASMTDQLGDVAAAVTYLKTNATQYNIDPAAIFVIGHSAGGHLALMSAWAMPGRSSMSGTAQAHPVPSQKNNADVRGIVALSPILDIAHMRANKEPEFNTELTVPFFGSGDKDAEQSPATYANAKSTPALILFGEKDYAYLIAQGKTYTQKFSAQSLSQITIETIPSIDHSGMVTDVNSKKDQISDKIAQYILKAGKTR